MEELIVNIDGKAHKVKVEEKEDGRLKVYCGDDVYEVETKDSIKDQLEDEISKGHDQGSDNNVIKAPLPGIIFSIDVKTGDKVKKGQKLLTIIAMKMENEIAAPKNGKIKDIRIKKNDSINAGDIIIILE